MRRKGQAAVITYPNQLTILRIVFVPVFVFLLLEGRAQAATVLFFLAAVTDGLDGLLARTLDQETALGSILDPLADKLLVTAAFITLTFPSVPVAQHIPLGLTATTMLRDLLIGGTALGIWLRTGRRDFPPSMLGKCTTAAQLSTVGAALIANFNGFGMAIFPALVYSTWILTVVSGLHYLVRTVVQELGRNRRADVDQGSHDSSRPGRVAR